MTTAQEIGQYSDGALNILTAAEPLFAEHGYEGTSLNAIAKKAGVSKANIFHHFENKESLYLQVLKQASSEMSALIDKLENTGDSAEDQIRQYTQQHLEGLFTKSHITRLILREMQNTESRHNVRMAQDVLGENFSRFVALLKNSQASGSIRNDIPAAIIAMSLVAGNVFYFQVNELLEQFPDLSAAKESQDYSAMLADITLNGILNRRK
ncbi:MAG: TetR/AcrR family transcriptional regulator [Gammaproteobacteria bacterium]|nr:TetR/AcrR family transcriptional regulator [Gammaproteobacteria bacterium]